MICFARVTAFWGHDLVCDPELLFIVGVEEEVAFPKLDAVRTASRYQPAGGRPVSTDCVEKPDRWPAWRVFASGRREG